VEPGNCVGPGLGCATQQECLLHCDTDGDPEACAPASGPIVVDARETDANIECIDGACAGFVIECRGPHTCFVNCNGVGSCDDLEMRCSPDGPCTLECENGACEGVPDLFCGDNRCTASCLGAMKTIEWREDGPGDPCEPPTNAGNCIVQ
jgi:hypothetical protein